MGGLGVVERRLEDYEEARGYRLITFNVPVDLGVVGFIATISSILAQGGIGIFSLSAFTRDHMLVQQEDLDQAIELLSGLISDCRARLDE